MIDRAELENQLVHEIHYLPIEAIETMLKLVSLMKKDVTIDTAQHASNFVDFIRNSPLMEVELDLTRDDSLFRDTEL